jgi:hypothetical protein
MYLQRVQSSLTDFQAKYKRVRYIKRKGNYKEILNLHDAWCILLRLLEEAQQLRKRSSMRRANLFPIHLLSV